MKKRLASKEITNQIRRLANDTKNVRLTDKAKYGLMGSPLTKLGLCDEICEWIDNNQSITVTETTEPPEHVGKPAYVIKPKIGGIIYYMRFSIDETNISSERLIIISVHPDT